MQKGARRDLLDQEGKTEQGRGGRGRDLGNALWSVRRLFDLLLTEHYQGTLGTELVGCLSERRDEPFLSSLDDTEHGEYQSRTNDFAMSGKNKIVPNFTGTDSYGLCDHPVSSETLPISTYMRVCKLLNIFKAFNDNFRPLVSGKARTLAFLAPSVAFSSMGVASRIFASDAFTAFSTDACVWLISALYTENNV